MTLKECFLKIWLMEGYRHVIEQKHSLLCIIKRFNKNGAHS